MRETGETEKYDPYSKDVCVCVRRMSHNFLHIHRLLIFQAKKKKKITYCEVLDICKSKICFFKKVKLKMN